MCLLDVTCVCEQKEIKLKRVDSDWRRTVIAASAALRVATRNMREEGMRVVR